MLEVSRYLINLPSALLGSASSPATLHMKFAEPH